MASSRRNDGKGDQAFFPGLLLRVGLTGVAGAVFDRRALRRAVVWRDWPCFHGQLSQASGMAISAAPTVQPGDLTAGVAEPVLEAGDRLSRGEFERRYERLPDLKKAELIEGWELREGDYQELAAASDGLLKSGVFPGLWLDATALLRGDMKAVLAALQRGLGSPEHGAFLSA